MNGSENGRGSASSLISRATREPRTRSAVSWSEFLPRYLLIEDALKKKNVLEIGTLDIRSLLRLHDAGAARVLGTSPDLSRFDRSLLRGRAIDVVRMDSGRLDFGDAAFDVILVVDLAKELAHAPEFLRELRRILRPDGFALLGYAASGRSLVELIDDDPKILALEPKQVEQSVRAVFPEARFYVQAPFVGVTIHPQDLDPAEADVSLDPSLAGASHPSHVIALCGRAPAAAFRTLVELPFVAFEAMTEAAQERTHSDFARLVEALRLAREQIAARDRSLEAIKKRLPRIREAIVASRRAESSVASETVPSPTVLDRPTDDGRVRDLEARIADLNEALKEERELRFAAEARVRALEEERPLERPDLEHENDHDTFIQDSEVAALERALLDREMEKGRLEQEVASLREREILHAREIERLEARARELALELEAARVRSERNTWEEAELAEARRRITHLERTASLQEQEIEELRSQLESQFLVRHSLGDEFRDAEARIAFLTARIEDLSLGHAQELKRAEERILFLTNALSTADQERETLRARLDELEEAARSAIERNEHVERGHRHASQELEAERAELYLLRYRFDELRIELHEKSAEVDQLERALADRDALIMQLKQEHSSSGADKRAVEMAAAHLGKEVETLRKRVQELRNERDTLAATSQLLLEERDAAAVLARRAVEAEERAQNLQLSLEGGQAAIERLERELDEATRARDAMEQRYLQAAEKIRMLEKDLERHRISNVEVNGRLDEEQSKQRELDKKLAELALRVNEAHAARDRAIADKAKIEELMLEAHQEAANASRDVRRLEEKIAKLEEQQKDAEQEIGRVLAERARAEAEAIRARAIADDYRGKNALLVAELGEAMERDRGLREKLSRAARDLESAQLALSRTLSEAAGLDARIKDLERSLEAGERERMQIEHQRQAAESARKSAEAARAHAVAEVRALTAERAQLQARYEADLHAAQKEIERLERDETLSKEIEHLEAERLALIVWAEELEISRKLAEANAERLRTDSARHQVATEEAQDEARILDMKLRELQRSLEIAEDRSEREEIEAELGLLRAENERLTAELVKAKGDLAECLDAIEILELESAELAERLARSRAERMRVQEETEDRIATLSIALAEAREARAIAETRARDADGQLTEAVAWLEATEQRAAEAEAKLNETARELLQVDERLLDACAELERVRAEMQAELQKAEQRASELSQRIEELEGVLSEARSELANRQNAVADAREKAERAEQRIAELERSARELEEVRAELSEKQRRIGILEGSEREAVDLRVELAGAQAEIGDLRSKLEASVAELGAAKSEGASLRSQREESSRRIAELEGELAKARERVSALEQSARDASDLLRRMELVERRAGELTAQLASAELRASAAETRAQNAERTSAELEAKLKELEARPIDRSLEERALRAEQNAARIEAQLAKEASAARDAETRARNAEAQAREAEERANASDNRRRTSEVRALDAEAKAKVAERKAIDLEQRVKQLEALLERGDGAGSEVLTAPLRAQIESLEQALDEARADVGRKLVELRAAREERAKVEMALEQERERRAVLEEKLARQGDADLLKEDLDRRDQQIARFRAEVASMTAEKNRLRALIQSSEQNQVQLERRIAELETALAESNQQLEILRRDLSERTERLRRLSSGLNEPG